MTSPKMRATIVVRNPETLQAVALIEGTEVPDWATDLVHPDDVDNGSTTKATAKKAASGKSD